MTATLVHRGPDGEGHALREHCGLGFRRLAIVDVDAPSAPFSNEDQTVWTVCNGEIYNADELREKLEQRGHRLRTRVDTETLPHLYEEFGPGLVEQLDGMFALAVFDERQDLLLLARDRAGEKPLFYWRGSGEVVFASELRAILAHPGVGRTLDPVALRRYLLHDYFPAPLSPIQDVQKLPAAHLLLARSSGVSVRPYWDLADHVAPREADGGDPRKLAREVDRRIGLAVRRRKRSDVPVGVFLSGGVDSSAILAHLAEQNGPGVPVFALGHRNPGFDESRFARSTALHFGADYDELVLDRADLADGLARVGRGFDEPLGDSSTIPTLLLSLHARRKVKVVLSGEGGDELFAGYPTYAGDRLAEAYRRLPAMLRRALAGLARGAAPVRMGNVGLDYLLARFLSAAERPRLERHHVWFGSLSPERQARVLAPAVLRALGHDDPFGSARSRVAGRRFPDPLAELLYTDFTMYLQDDLLTKVDRAAMLASLEARAPFLDHELVQFVAGIPSRFKLQRFKTKAILRRALERRLPREVLTRRKRGFTIPFSQWLLDGLGQRLRERFAPERVSARGLFAPAGVTALLDDHLTGRADHRKPLFTLLALDLWCDRVWGEGARVPVAEPSPDTAVLARALA